MANSGTPPNSDRANIAFIGAGNMARSLMGGLIQQGYPADKLSTSDPAEVCLSEAGKLGAVRTSSSNADIVEQADVVILAVKPQVMADAVLPLQSILKQRKPLLVSIAAGIPCASIQKWAGEGVPIVRCMPNTPALLQSGATGLYATADVQVEQRSLAESILNAVGISVWVDEEAGLDAVTAVSGSGPAYFFLLMEAMQAVGEKLGLSAETSAIITQQTALGAARMVVEGDVDVAELRKRVTSPNGTTQAAIESFEKNGIHSVVEKAMRAAFVRSEELAKELG